MYTQGLFPKKPIWMLWVTAVPSAAPLRDGWVCQPCPKFPIKPSPPESWNICSWEKNHKYTGKKCRTGNVWPLLHHEISKEFHVGYFLLWREAGGVWLKNKMAPEALPKPPKKIRGFSNSKHTFSFPLLAKWEQNLQRRHTWQILVLREEINKAGHPQTGRRKFQPSDELLA